MWRSSARVLRWRTGSTHLGRRFNSQKATTPSPALSPTPPPSSSFQRILARTPKFLRPTLSALHNAPLTHVTAFLLLHEITAVVPLFGLAGAFHYYHWLPPYFAEGAWVVSGVEKFGRYFKKKGWIKAGEEAEVEREVRGGRNAADIEKGGLLKWWDRGEGGLRWVIEFATAYAVVKALLPVRIVVSVCGAPWFAKWTVIPVGQAVKRLFRRGRTVGASAGSSSVVSKKP